MPKTDEEIENIIIGKLVDSILAAGFAITVNDGEDDVVLKSVDKQQIVAALRSTDEDYLHVRHENGRHGWVRLIYGNGDAVISDYTTRIEDLVNGAEALAEELTS